MAKEQKRGMRSKEAETGKAESDRGGAAALRRGVG
jgi:hypothetical protein